jgi:hypothetical protein
MMKLKSGKKYETADGTVVGPMFGPTVGPDDDGYFHAFINGLGGTWHSDGTRWAYGISCGDLIRRHYTKQKPALSAALTQSRAETAAAYERAAWVCVTAAHERRDQLEAGRNVPAHAVNVPQQMRWSAGAIQAETLRDAIRALATPDQSSALAGVIVDVRENALREASEICAKQSETFASKEYSANQPLASFNERFACEECRTAILAAITQEK